MHHQHEFPLAALRRGFQPRCQRLGGQGAEGFVLFGQLACQRHRALAQHGQCRGQRADAVRCLQQHHRACLLLQRLQGLLALLPLGRQKAGKHPTPLQAGHAIAVLRAFHASGTQGRDDAARSRQGHHAQTGSLHRPHQPGPRIADRRRTRIAHIGHALPLLQPFHHLLRCLLFIVLVQRQQTRSGRGNAIGAQHLRGMARVLAGNHIHQLQHMQRAQRNVGQIADRRGDQIERAGGI